MKIIKKKKAIKKVVKLPNATSTEKRWQGHIVMGIVGNSDGMMVEVVLDNGSTAMCPKEFLEL